MSLLIRLNMVCWIDSLNLIKEMHKQIFKDYWWVTLSDNYACSTCMYANHILCLIRGRDRNFEKKNIVWVYARAFVC